MSKYVLLFGVVLAISGTVAGSILDDISFSGSLSDFFGGTSPTVSALDNSFAPTSTPTMSVIRPMRVTIDPARPQPSEEVVATISGRTSDPYLTLNDTQVSRNGNDIEIELGWITFVPRTLDTYGAEQSLSTGYGVEQTRPWIPGASTLESWDVSVSLGTFDAGTYRIHVDSRGALEGEAEATFEVRQSQSTFFDLLPVSFPWPSLLW